MLLLRDGQAQAPAIHRADYQAPAWWIDTVDLTFDLDPAKTRVLNKMRLRRNPDVAAQPLRLDGEELNLARVMVNGGGTSFKMNGNQLVLENLPEGTESFDLEIFTTCAPTKNTQLMGLYVSQGTFFTQCEAQGFRRITYFLDRPDVMASYTVTLRADKALYPVLLSNGNLVDSGALEDGRHFAKWVDPHKKPCYLFALVAGKLVAREQLIKSRSGSNHLLQVYVRPGDLGKTEHAMNSLMYSVAWDEARFGLPLDLERFMIVATSDFNMGAMENKGLNIFNTKYVLASEATATDTDDTTGTPTPDRCAEASASRGQHLCEQDVPDLAAWSKLSLPVDLVDQARTGKYLVPARADARVVEDQVRRAEARARRLAHGLHLGGQRHGLRGIPLRHHTGMHHQPSVRMNSQALLADPVKPVVAVGCIQDFVQRVAAVGFAHAMGHGQQVQVVVAQQAGGRVVQPTQAAQHAQRIRAPVNQVAQHIDVIPGRGEIKSLQQPLKRVATTLQVAN